jgi:hypothetical protein
VILDGMTAPAAIGLPSIGPSTSLLRRGRPALMEHRVRRWQRAFSDADRLATPTLALAAARTQLVAGQGHLVEHWMHAAAAVGTRSSAIAADLRMLRAALARDGLARMRVDAESPATSQAG